MVDITSIDELIDDISTTTPALAETEPTPIIEPINEGTKTTVETKKPIDKKLIEATSSVLINVANVAQKNIFKFLGTKKLIVQCNEITTDNLGYTKLKEAYAIANGNGASIHIPKYTIEQNKLLAVGENVKVFIDGLPFTAEEKKQLELPLNYILEQNQGVIPPEISLILAFGTLIGGRIGELVTI